MIECALDDVEGTDYVLLVADSAKAATGAAKGEPIGFAVFGPTPCAEGTWDLYWIAVDPEVANRGAGSKILAAVESACVRRGARLLKVETASKSSYDATRAFYDRRRYTVAARIADFYAPGDDLVMYVKRWSRETR